MSQKSTHEPLADVMSAEEVWEDAQSIADVLRKNLRKGEPVVELQIPFSVLLSALDRLSQDELMIVRRRLHEKLSEEKLS